MIYNTTIASVAGDSCTDVMGRNLKIIGNQNVYIGKNVYTDGVVVYGYDFAGFIPNKIGKIVTREDNFITSVSTGEYASVNWRILSQYATERNEGFKTGTLLLPDTIFCAGNKLYYKNGNTIGDNEGNSITLQSSSLKIRDCGKNGGILLFENYNKIVFIHDFNTIKEITMDEIMAMIDDWPDDVDLIVDAYGHFNVDENKIATCTIAASIESYTHYYTLSMQYSNGEWNLELSQYQNPKLDDEIGVFAVTEEESTVRPDFPTKMTISDAGTVTIDNVSFPVSKNDKCTIAGDYVLVYPLPTTFNYSNSHIYQYDKTGTLLRDYYHDIFAFNNYRLIACNGKRMFRKWGYTTS